MSRVCGRAFLGQPAMMTDEQFFATHLDRQARIRLPAHELTRNSQRAVYYRPECGREFATLGEHHRSRRRVILWKVPPGNPYWSPDRPAILKIPFLTFSDETIEDTDAILLPIIHQIMMEAAVREGAQA